MNNNDLNNNISDYSTAVLSGAVSAVPFVGGALAEIVNITIPNQRMDRVVKFVNELSIELKELGYEIEELKSKIDSKYCYGAYITNCLRTISNEIYEEKINYYKKLCISGLTGDEKNLKHCERILQILGELDFYEIQYLRYYYDPRLSPTEMMKDAISKIGFELLFPSYNLGMNENEIMEETYKTITLNNLEKNGLIEKKINLRTNKSKYEITTLGRMILKKIGYDEIKVF